MLTLILAKVKMLTLIVAVPKLFQKELIVAVCELENSRPRPGGSVVWILEQETQHYFRV